MLISTSLWHLSVVLMHEMGQKENEKLKWVQIQSYVTILIES